MKVLVAHEKFTVDMLNSVQGYKLQTLLHKAVLQNWLEVVKVILPLTGLEINKLDNQNKTALDYHDEDNHEAEIKTLLIAAGAKTKAQLDAEQEEN